MELGDKDKFGQEKRGGDSVNYHSPGLSSDWRFGSSNLSNTSIGLVPADNCIEVCKGNLIGSSTSSSVPMVDSISSPLWDQSNAQNLGLCDSNIQASVSTSNTIGIRKGVPGSLNAGMDKGLDMSWNLPSSMARGGLFLQNSGGVLPQSLSQFPADSAFIERAARFSCFSAGNFVDMVNPFNASDSLGPYSRVGGVIQGQPEVLPINGLKLVSGIQSQKNEVNPSEIAKDVSLSVELGTTGGSLTKNERECGGFVRPPDEAKQGIGSSSNESDEAEFSGGCRLEETVSGGPSAKGLGSKKRKRSAQDSELDQNKGALQLPSEAAKDDNEIKQKGHQNPITATTKPIGKQGKDGSQASDAPKEDYIHVRARRGQATNSHSLAERVRREKISERMKFLQDLVPGCSKVTGKAVMLDEIINYVQSLQRQVEFLSMKLAAVNPRLDFNIEGLLTKDILQSRGGPSSTMGFSLDMSMAHHQMHSSHQGLIQAGIPGMANPSDALRRAINSHLTAMSGGFKDPNSQMPHAWDDELHNVVQMNFGTSSSFNNQELNGSLPPGHMKIEL